MESASAKTAPVGDPYADTGEGKIARSWRLTGTAWELIRTDRAMLAIAVMQTVGATVAFGAILYLTGYIDHPRQSGIDLALIGLIALYPMTFISVFFGVALAAAASDALEGRHMKVREALGVSVRRLPAVALWSLLAAGVGALLEEIASRIPWGGRIAEWLLGAAWALATIFVVPVLALEKAGPIAALRRSGQLLKSRWGETIAGSLTILAWATLAFIPACLILGSGFAAVRRDPGLGVALISAGIVILVLVSAGTAGVRQVFAVALYRFAAEGEPRLFTLRDLQSPFTPKRSWFGSDRGDSSTAATASPRIPVGTTERPIGDESALAFEIERATDSFGSSWDPLGTAYGTGRTAAESAVLAVATKPAVYRARRVDDEDRDWTFFFVEPQTQHIHRRAPL